MILGYNDAYVVEVSGCFVMVAASDLSEACQNALAWYNGEHRNYLRDSNRDNDYFTPGTVLAATPLKDLGQTPYLDGIYLTEAQFLHPFETLAERVQRDALNRKRYEALVAKPVKQAKAKTAKKPKAKKKQKRSAESIAKYKATMAAKKAERGEGPDTDALPPAA